MHAPGGASLVLVLLPPLHWLATADVAAVVARVAAARAAATLPLLTSPPSSPPLPPLASHARNRRRVVVAAAVVATVIVARVAAARHCLSAVSGLAAPRPHTVVAARRQIHRYHVVVTLSAAALALALPSATLPRACRAAAPAAPPRPPAAPASPASAPSSVGSSAAATNASSRRPCRRLRIMSRRTCASKRQPGHLRRQHLRHPLRRQRIYLILSVH